MTSQKMRIVSMFISTSYHKFRLSSRGGREVAGSTRRPSPSGRLDSSFRGDAVRLSSRRKAEATRSAPLPLGEGTDDANVSETLRRRVSQSVWKTSSMPAHHSPSARLLSGSWHGLQQAHHFCVVGSAAILAMSASKSAP